MITDEQLQKMSLVLAIIGIIGIVIVSLYTEPEKLEISKITEDKLGRIVQASGTITSFFTKDGHVFIDLQDTSGTVQVIIFERTARNQKDAYNLKKSDNVTVIGKVLLYKSKIEIQADKIEII